MTSLGPSGIALSPMMVYTLQSQGTDLPALKQHPRIPDKDMTRSSGCYVEGLTLPQILSY